MKHILFFSVFLTLLSLLNLYIYFRFLSKLTILQPYLFSLKLFVGTLFLFQVVYAATFRYGSMPALPYLIFASAIGITFILGTIAIGYDVVSSLAHFILKDKFLMFKSGFDIFAIIFTVVYITFGFIGGIRDPSIVHVKVPFALPPSIKSFRIVQISDVHAGHVIKRPFVERMVSRINELHPDMVVNTGDLIDIDPKFIKNDLEPLAKIKTNYGTYSVMGNHEYFHKPTEGLELLQTLSLNVLDDESRLIVDKNGHPLFNLVGVRDLMGERFPPFIPNPQKAFSQIDSSYPTLLLAHQPAWINHSEIEQKLPDLILSGHTHGGQIFPFHFLVKLIQPYVSGLHQYKQNRYVYVSSGTGYWGPPLRLFAPTEITVLDLQRVE